jgi:hypothetical protein
MCSELMFVIEELKTVEFAGKHGPHMAARLS